MNCKQNMRETSWDIAKLVCILLMIFGHCVGYPRCVYTAIESFHMPFFFIAAGFFYKVSDTKSMIQSSFKRLVIPLFVGSAICAVISLVLNHPSIALNWCKGLLFPGGTGRKVWFCSSWPDLGVFWFLAALFWCRILYNEIVKHIPQCVALICFALSFMFAMVSRRLALPFGIREGCCGLVFYAFGRLMREKSLLDIKISPWFVALFLGLWLIETQFVSFHMYGFGYDFYYPIGVLFACGMGWLLVKFTRTAISVDRGGQFAKYGRYTLEIMCCHQITRTIIDNMEWWNKYDSSIVNVVLIVGSIILSIVYIWIKTKICKTNFFQSSYLFIR